MPLDARHPWLLPTLLLGMAPLGAFAVDAPGVIPGINGHMTDPQQKLIDSEKTEVEDRLTKIQEDTHIDVAGWITDAPSEQLLALGTEAYRRWNIGKDWDNGVFLIFPGFGRVKVILDRSKPALTPAEEAKLVNIDNPNDAMQGRIDRLADNVRSVLVSKTQKQARPWGKARPELGFHYLLATVMLVVAGAGVSVGRRMRLRVAR